MKEVNDILKAITTTGSKTTKLDILNYIKTNSKQAYLEKIILNLNINRTVALDCLKGLLSVGLIAKRKDTLNPTMYRITKKGDRILSDIKKWV